MVTDTHTDRQTIAGENIFPRFHRDNKYGHTLIFLCSSREVLCLQVEPCDDTSGNDVPVVLSNSRDIITSSGVADEKQVNNFISDGFVTKLAFTDIINGTVY